MKDSAEYSKNLYGGICTVHVPARCRFCSGDRLCGGVCVFIASIIVGGFSIFSSAAIFMSPSFCWLYVHYVWCWKIRLKNGMSKKKKMWRSTWVQKLKTNHRSWEHNLSHTRHLSSHTSLMFRDFTDKLREWSSLIEPGHACSCHHKLLCSHGRDLSNFRCDLSSHTPWEQGFKEFNKFLL